MVANKFARAPRRLRVPAICRCVPPPPPPPGPPPTPCPTTWQSATIFNVLINIITGSGTWFENVGIPALETGWGGFYGEVDEPGMVGTTPVQFYHQISWQMTYGTCIYYLQLNSRAEAAGFYLVGFTAWKTGEYNGGLPFDYPQNLLMIAPYTGQVRVSS